MDQSDKVSFLGCCLVVMTIASRQFGDNDPDNEETHRGLDVGAVGDGELLIGTGEEVVEPHRGRDRATNPETRLPSAATATIRPQGPAQMPCWRSPNGRDEGPPHKAA